MTIDLKKLAEPFPNEDIEWRVSRSGRGSKGIFCMVLAYITARALQKRFDEVCNPENWRVERPYMIDVNGKTAFAVGLSIRIDSEWITKWDVAEPTNIEPAKGAFSSAEKRAGVQWGCGRYLHYLDETFAEVAETQPDRSRSWIYAKLAEKHGGDVYYWKKPSLPSWALPKEPEHEISADELYDLKQAWRAKFAGDVTSTTALLEGFTRFVASVAGEFPLSDYTCWTRAALQKCAEKIEATTDPDGPDADVPFDGAKG